MDNESEVEDDPCPTPPKKPKIRETNKHRQQKFRKEWLKVELFRDWLLPHEDEFRAKCRVCPDKTLVAELTMLKNHAQGKAHSERLKPKMDKSQPSVSTFLKATPISKAVSIAEIKIAAFISEHNIAFRAADHLTDMLKDIFKDSATAQKMCMKRDKAKAIIKNVIGATHNEDLAEKLRKVKFSILTDESTDIGCIKTSCVVVRYFDVDSGHIESKFWEVYEIFDSNNTQSQTVAASGENLYNALMKSFQSQQVPIKNMLGFGADGCNTMMGANNSISSRLRASCPGIVVMKSVCHSAHICASEACKSLPKPVEDLARNIYNYFKLSARRQALLKQFQAFFDIEPHKILHPSQTRWLSLVEVVKRILEQWMALKAFFMDQMLVEHVQSAENIYNSLDDPFYKLYLLFLEWALPKFTRFNEFFQSKKAVIVEMHGKIRELYQGILLDFLKRPYVMSRDLSQVNSNDANQQLNDNALYLGIKVKTLVDSEQIASQPERRAEFFTCCRKFLVTAAEQIRKRYNMDDPVLVHLNFLKPKNALSLAFRDTAPSLSPLMDAVPRALDSENTDELLQKIDDQWRRLPVAEARIPEGLKNEEPDVMWAKIRELCPDFSELCAFALNVLSIPHSNADCERVFSSINLMKTKTRNKLITGTINGSLLATQCIKTEQSGSAGTCITFRPSAKMLEKMTSHVLYEPSTATQDGGKESDDEVFFRDG